MLYKNIMKPQSDSNSGARLELKKLNKPKETQPQEQTLKPVIEEKSKEKGNKDNKAKVE